jgi:FSR family fosmidomycin resistance protein-like MFS transporter
MSLLFEPSFAAAALAHLAVDLLNAQRPLLLVVLSVPLGLSNTLIGVISVIYTFAASISQPLFGWVADRLGGRWVATGGVLWMAGMFGLAVLSPGYLSLVLLVLAALGSGAFHPAGTVEAAEIGRIRFAGRETTAASVFFLFGQAGYSFGPAIGGPVVDKWGPAGLLVFLPLVVPAGINAGLHFTPFQPATDPETAARAPLAFSRRWVLLVPFILLAALRSWSQSNMTTFLPKYYSDLGYSPSLFGVMAALFMGGSALGGVGGGWLADHYSRRAVTVLTLLLGVVPLALFPALGQTAWAYFLSPIAGALTGASNSIVIVEAQRMMPQRLGTASGLVLGFMFAAGSVGTMLSGLQLDRVGFTPFFFTTAGITLAAAAMGLWLGKE